MQSNFRKKEKKVQGGPRGHEKREGSMNLEAVSGSVRIPGAAMTDGTHDAGPVDIEFEGVHF